MSLPFGVNTYPYTLDRTAADCVAHLGALGFAALELMIFPGHLWPSDMDGAARRHLRRQIERNGLRLVTINMPNIDVNIGAAAPEMRRLSLDLLRSVIDLAGDLGAHAIIVGPGKPNPLLPMPKERLMGYFHAALDELLPLAERSGTALYVENMPFAFLADADSLMQALEALDPEGRIGVVYDLANGVFIGEDLGAGLRRVAPRLKLVHLSDTGLARYGHAPIGQGVVPFAEVPPVLAQLGHAELPILEIISPAADADLSDSAHRLLAMGWGRRHE